MKWGSFMSNCILFRKKRFYSAAIILLVTIFAFVFSNTDAEAANSSTKTDVVIEGTRKYDYAFEMFEILNQERSNAKVSTITLDEELTELAMQRASELAVSFSHTRPDGSSCYTISDRLNGENISIGYSKAEDSMNGFMNSEGHKANILRSDFKSVGIGCVTVDGITYWAQCFSCQKSVNTLEKIPDNVSLKFSINTLNSKLDLMFKEGTAMGISVNHKKQLTLYSINKEYSSAKFLIRNTDVVWSSSNSNVCSVDKNGLVTAKSEGTAIIRCTLNGITAEAVITVPKAYILESNHPYENSLDETYTLNYPNAENIEFTFNEETSVENYFDNIYIYDKYNNLIGKYTGTSLAGKTINVSGDKVYIRLVSDSIYNDYGFAVEKVNVKYPESNNLSIQSFTASKSDAKLGESITLKTTATGANLKYKYIAELNGTWTTIRANNTTSSYTWKPTEKGTYTVRVIVSDGINEVKKDIKVNVASACEISSFTASSKNLTIGSSTTLKTTATGANLKYKYIAELNGTWTTIRASNTTSSYTWKPTEKGTYTVRVIVSDGINEVKKDIKVNVVSACEISSFTASSKDLTIGSSTTLKTTATGANLKYKYIAELNGTWTTIRASNTTSSYTWKPTEKGTYTVRVIVSDGINEVKKDIKVNVVSACEISSFTASSKSLTVGSSTTLKTTATGANLKYKYIAELNGTWTTIRASNTTSSYTWKPTEKGTYTVRVIVSDGINEARKDIKIVVS